MVTVNNTLIVLVVNDALDHWCDYATQTIRYLAARHRVVVFCCGDCVTWKSLFRNSGTRKKRRWGAELTYPFFLIPWQRFPFIKKLNYLLNAFVFSIQLALRFRQYKKVFWFFDPINMRQIFPFFQSYISVYDCVDFYHGESSELAYTDQYLLTQSTYVFANSYILGERLKPYRKDIQTVPLGFAVDLFASQKQRHHQHKAIVAGFVGGITRRIDFELLTAVARRCQRIQFVFYGPITQTLRAHDGGFLPEVDTFFRLPNVHWKGFALKRNMPRIISNFDIGIIPYRTVDAFNAFCFPMKTMEYFYMGKPILSTDILELRRFPHLVFISNSAQTWIHHIHQLSVRAWPKDKQREERIIAEQNSWDKKLAYICRRVSL